MRKQIDMLQDLVERRILDIEAVSASLDEVQFAEGVKVAVVVKQARRAIAEVASGKSWYKPLLRHAIKRLVVLLEKQVAESLPCQSRIL